MAEQRSNPKEVFSKGRWILAAFCAICLALVASWMFSKIQIPGHWVTVESEQNTEALMGGDIHDLKPMFFQAAAKFAREWGISDSAVFFCSMSVYLEYQEFDPDSTLLAAYNEAARVKPFSEFDSSQSSKHRDVRVVMDALPQWIRDPNFDEVVLRPSCWVMMSSEDVYFRGLLVLSSEGAHAFSAQFLPVTELRRGALRG